MKSSEVVITSLGRRLLTCLLFGALLFLCACGGGGYDMTVTVDPAEGTQIPADGLTAANIKVTLKKDGDLLNSGNIDFATNLGSLKESKASPSSEEEGKKGDEEKHQLSVQLSMGSAAVQLSSVQAGQATVRIEFKDEETETVEASVELKIDFKYALAPETAKVATIEFISAEPETIKIFNTTAEGQTSTKITFQVLDKLNLPIANKPVYFSIPKPLGEASIVPLSTKTDINGYAVTYLTSGRVAGVAEIIAGNELYENRTDDYVSGAAKIHVIAGSANFNNFSFECDTDIIGGFNSIGIKMGCRAYVADRDTQEIPNQPVLFVTEAGAVIPMIYTDENGLAETTYYTQDPIPFPVPPNPLANLEELNILTITPSSDIGQALAAADNTFSVTSNESYVSNSNFESEKLMYDSNYWDGLMQRNPRDGVSTIIAITAGEEPLTKDINQNGICDDGDTFLSIGEPFVDRNDDGIYNEGEYFLDIDNNGYRTDPEGDATHRPYNLVSNNCGAWKKDTQIWKQTTVMWVGSHKYAGFLVMSASSGVTAATGKLLGPEDSVELTEGSMLTARVYALDKNLNSIHGNENTKLQCSIDTGGKEVSLAISPASQGINMINGPAALGEVTITAPAGSPDEPYKPGAGMVTCTASPDYMLASGTYSYTIKLNVIAK